MRRGNKMSKLKQRMKLANEAARLIEEFRGEEGILGHNTLQSVSIKEDGRIIEVDDEFEGVIEYSITNISSVFALEMRGWGPCPAGFYEAISLAEGELEYEFKRLSKKEFKEYVGNLKYAEYRCEEIYKRLKEIEREALELEK